MKQKQWLKVTDNWNHCLLKEKMDGIRSMLQVHTSNNLMHHIQLSETNTSETACANIGIWVTPQLYK